MDYETTLVPGTDESREDQYQVVQQIGSGSFGDVFLVLHKQEGRQYVMKTITLLTTMEEKQRQSTELEVKLLSALQHPNIVAFRDSFKNREGHLCIFMEYCEHGDVYTYLREAKQAGKMPDERRVLEWFIQIALALQALHHRHILHRDLKTQNIFLTGNKPQFATKLGDFGIAKVLNSTQELAKTQIGTPFYMSPELINNKPYSYKSDIWGLGCTLYELINGHHAFEAQSLNGLAFKIMKGRYTPCTANCSEDTKGLIKSMLSMSPSHRPTLKEILHMPSLRRRIPHTVQVAASAGVPEAKTFAEQVLTEQLASIGLGGLVNRTGLGPRRDRKRLLQRLERAELRKQRDEELLQRLQKTAAILEQCLESPNLSFAHSRHGELPLVSDASSGSGFNDQRRAYELSGGHFGHPSYDEHTRHQVASQEMGPLNFTPRGTSYPAEQMSSPDPHLKGLLDLKHITPANLANPFENCRPSVIHSPRRRGGAEPRPPPPQFGQPLPPHGAAVPPHRWSRWQGGEQPMQNSRSMHSVYLEALNTDHRGNPEHSGGEESSAQSSGSLSEDGMSELSSRDDRNSDMAQMRLQSQAVQQRIDQCQAAIYRHKMTIETLAFNVAEENAAGMTGAEASNAYGAGDDRLAKSKSGPCRQPMPALVQDRLARLVRCCHEGLGREKFVAAKRCLQLLLDAAEAPSLVRPHMLELLGLDKIGFYSILDQIVYMERRFGAQHID